MKTKNRKEMENKTDSTWITEDKFPDGKIILLDGRVADCHPRTTNEQPPYTDKERKEEDKVRFIKNAFFFLAHKERILTDSRMFLCPVPIESIGFADSTLGIYLQWWETCAGAMFTDKKGRRGLLYKLSGSSLSGHNIADVVHEDGTTKNVELHPFKDYRNSFIHINNIYKSAKQKYQAYSLQQVLDILDHEEEGDHDYAHAINEQFQSQEINVLNERVHHLNARIEMLEHSLSNARQELREEKLLHFYDRYKDLEMHIFSKVEQLLQQKRDLKMALRRGDYTNQVYERQVNDITKRINEAEEELEKFKSEEINRVFPNENLLFCQIESEVNKIRERNDKTSQKDHQ